MTEIELKTAEYLQKNGKKYASRQIKSTQNGDYFLAVWVDVRELYTWFSPITHPFPIDLHRQLNPLALHWLCTPCVKCNDTSAGHRGGGRRPGGRFHGAGHSEKLKYNICTGSELYITNLRAFVTVEQLALRIQAVQAPSHPVEIDKHEYLCRLTFSSPEDRSHWLRLAPAALGAFPTEWVLPGQMALLVQAPHPLTKHSHSEATAHQLSWDVTPGGSAPVSLAVPLAPSGPQSSETKLVSSTEATADESEESAPTPIIHNLVRVSNSVQIHESWQLGVGGASVVFAGMWDRFRAAIKRFDKKQISEIDKESWLNEVEILMDLQSADATNIVRVFGFEDSTQFFYLAMERCEFSLLDALPPRVHNDSLTDSKLPVETKELREWIGSFEQNADAYYRLCVVMRGFLKGLLVLHSNRIIHRDISPGNVLFLRDSYNGTVPLYAATSAALALKDRFSLFL